MENMKEEVINNIKNAPNDALNLIWYMLENTPYEKIVKEEIANRIAKHRAELFIRNCPIFV